MRESMIDTQLRPNGIKDGALLEGFRRVDRALFVPASRRSFAYSDCSHPLGGGYYLPAPLVIAQLAQFAALSAGETVLVVGDQSGYMAALLCHLTRRVLVLVTGETGARVEKIQEHLLGQGLQAVVVSGENLTDGLPSEAPFDAILLAGASAIPPLELMGLGRQLAPKDGRLVGLFAETAESPGQIKLMMRRGDHFSVRDGPYFSTEFLPGFEPRAHFVF